MIKAYWHLSKNFGDTLTPIVVEHFTGQKVEFAPRRHRGKLIAIGSVIVGLRENDIIWGTGSIRAGGLGAIRQPAGSIFLAVRGPLTRNLIRGNVPRAYGDPAILLPLIYNPRTEKIHKIGIIPHSTEQNIVKPKQGEHFIDITLPWKKVIEEIKSCEKIISSSLHGIICAEAYGIPAQWAKYSDKIIGGQFKYQDYFLGTGRERQQYFTDIPPIQKLENRQKTLIRILQNYYGKN